MGNYKKNIFIFGFFLLLPLLFYSDALTLQGILGWLDGYLYSFPHKLFSARIWKIGEIPLWNPHLFCGFPQLAAFQTTVLYLPSILLFAFFPVVVAFNLNILLHFSLAGIFTYLYMRTLKVSTVPALFSGVAYMFCGFLVHWAHNVIVHNSSIWLPLILFLLEKIKNERKFIYVIWGSFSFAVLIFAGHPQILTYTTMVILFYIAYMTVNAKKDRYTVLLYGSLVFLLGGLLGAIQLLPAMELADLSIRTEITPDTPFISFASFNLTYLITFLFPYFFGTPYPGFYPMEYSLNFLFEGIGYIGILPLMLSFTAFLIKKDGANILFFWAFILLISFFLSMGNNNPFFSIICKIPFLNLFWNNTVHMFELNFAIAILGGLGLDSIVSGKRKQIRKKTAVFLTGALLVIAAGGGIYFKKAISGEMGNHYRDQLLKIIVITNPAIYVPIIFMIASGLIFWFLMNRPKNRIGLGILIIILFADLFFFGHFILRRSTAVDEFIQKGKYPHAIKFLQKTERDPNNYRVFPVISSLSEITSSDFVFSNNNILYPISSIAGYEPFYLKDHFALFNANRNGTFQDPLSLVNNNRIISLLNVKYLIVNPHHVSAIESVKAEVSLVDPKTDKSTRNSISLYEKVFTSSSGTRIFKNRNALPRTYLVSKIRPTENFDDAHKIMWNENDPFDPKQEALVEFNGSNPTAELTQGKATIISYRPRKIVIQTESDGKSFLVLSDTCYPGWKAFIDKQETPIYRTNGIVRGVFVTPGTNIIRFVYSPLSFKIGAFISFVTLAILLFLIACSLMRYKNVNSYKLWKICPEKNDSQLAIPDSNLEP